MGEILCCACPVVHADSDQLNSVEEAFTSDPRAREDVYGLDRFTYGLGGMCVVEVGVVR